MADDCGICDDDPANDNLACIQDCAGVWGGGAVEDQCGVCNGDGSSCIEDCAGVVSGVAYLDDCGSCVGGTTGAQPCDCAGDAGGTAYVDLCGVCVDGTTGLTPCNLDCNGVLGGDALIDECGQCAGGTTGLTPCEKDCFGTPGGAAFLDECGDCVEGLTGEVACAKDCDGDYDQLDILVNCDVTPAVPVDSCDGIESCVCSPIDANNYCAPDCEGTLDCAGVCDGPSQFDDCGICDSDPTNDCVEDCNGVYGGTAVLDDCGNCNLTDADSCGQVAFLAEFDLQDATFSEYMVFASQYWEIDISTFGDDEPAPVCTPNDQDICRILKSRRIRYIYTARSLPSSEKLLFLQTYRPEYLAKRQEPISPRYPGVMVAFVDENPPLYDALSLMRLVTIQSFRSPAVTDEDIAICSLYRRCTLLRASQPLPFHH